MSARIYFYSNCDFNCHDFIIFINGWSGHGINAPPSSIPVPIDCMRSDSLPVIGIFLLSSLMQSQVNVLLTATSPSGVWCYSLKFDISYMYQNPKIMYKWPLSSKHIVYIKIFNHKKWYKKISRPENKTLRIQSLSLKYVCSLFISYPASWDWNWKSEWPQIKFLIFHFQF
jgi:hypothetical protein